MKTQMTKAAAVALKPPKPSEVEFYRNSKGEEIACTEEERVRYERDAHPDGTMEFIANVYEGDIPDDQWNSLAAYLFPKS